VDGVVGLSEGEDGFQSWNVVEGDESAPKSKVNYASTATRILLFPSALGRHLHKGE
jgi:hypothetical protein